MAFELIGNFNTTVGAGETQLDVRTDVRPYAAALRLGGLDTCTVAVSWRVTFSTGAALQIWRSEDITVAGDPYGLMTPVVPGARTVELWFNLISGSPTAADVEWDVFGL